MEYDPGLRPQCGGVARWPVGRIWLEGSRCAVLGLSLGNRPVYAPGPQKFRYLPLCRLILERLTDLAEISYFYRPEPFCKSAGYWKW